VGGRERKTTKKIGGGGGKGKERKRGARRRRVRGKEEGGKEREVQEVTDKGARPLPPPTFELTEAPSAANFLHMASPMPDAPPVTTTTLPCTEKSVMFVICGGVM
jgi:hypothetical protein